MKPLRIALTKGRLEKGTVNLLEQIGLEMCIRDRSPTTASRRRFRMP